MTIEQYLGQYKQLEQRIQYHQRRLEDLQASVYTLSGPQLQADRVQGSRSRDPGFVAAFERIEKMEERIAREICMQEDLKTQMEDMFYQLLRLDYQLLMIYRYLEGMNWDEIGNLLHIAKSTLILWHRKALTLLQLPESPISIRCEAG